MKIHFVFLLIALVPSTTTQGQMNPNVPAWAAPLDDAHLLSDPLSRQNELMDMPNSHHARNIPEVLEVARDLLHQQGVQFSNARVIYGAEEGFLLPSLNIPEIARALTTPADSRDGLRPRRGQGLIFVAFDGRDLAEDNYRTDNDQIMLVVRLQECFPFSAKFISLHRTAIIMVWAALFTSDSEVRYLKMIPIVKINPGTLILPVGRLGFTITILDCISSQPIGFRLFDRVVSQL